MYKSSIKMRVMLLALAVSVLCMSIGIAASAAEKLRTGPSVDLSHGGLKVSDNGRYLIHADGTPFFYLGDTAWELFHRTTREEAEKYLENRRAKGFTVIQAVVLAELEGINIPNSNGDKPLIENDATKPNEAYFQHVDYIVKQASLKGLVMGILPTWGDKVGPIAWGTGPEKIINMKNAREYGVFLGKRYKDFPNIIWILGGDRTPKGFEAVWRELAAGLREGDGGSHPITYHPQGGMSSSELLNKEGWLDFNMLQSGHGAKNISNYTSITADYKKQPVKPCIDGEPRYEDHPINWDPKNGWFDDYDVRQGAYWGTFAGAMGTTYGCHDIWQMYLPGRTPISSARTPWTDALDLPGAFDVGHLRMLMESRPMLARVPDQTMLTAGKGSGESVVRATRGDDYAFVYSAAGKSFTLELGRISGSRVKAYWFDPREGNSIILGEFDNTGSMEFTPPGAKTGRGSDWVLVLDDASKGFAAPGGIREWSEQLPVPKPIIAAVADVVATAQVAAPANPVVAVPGTAGQAKLPRPVVELLFEKTADGVTPNTGSSSGNYPTAGLTDQQPVPVVINHGQGNENALDFGTKAGEYAVDLTGPTDILGGLDAFTITGWLNCKFRMEGPGGNRVLSWINAGRDGVDLVYRSNGSLQLSVNEWPDNSPARSKSGMILADAAAGPTNWVFFAVAYDSSLDTGNAKFYFGKSDAPPQLTNAIKYAKGPVGMDIGPDLTVGHFNTATRSGAVDRMFKGLIDDIRIYDKALTPEGISEVYKL